MRKQTKIVAALSATALLALGASAVSFAAGWDNSTGTWQYLDNNGSAVTDVWRKSGDYWFYLDSDGNMATDTLVEKDDDKYYVNADGAMVTNQWVALDSDSYDTSSDDGEAEYRWYYFGSDGKAYRNKKSSTTVTTSELKTINGKKYAFDADGKMLYGWISKDSADIQTDDTAWQNSLYYFGGWNDGAAATGWVQMTVDTTGVSDDGDSETYWFYFDGNGKKQTSKKKTINGATYYFDEYGRMVDDWTQKTTDASGNNVYSSVNSDSTANDITYVNGDGAVRKNQWVWAVPAEDYDQTDYDDDDYSWWWTQANGSIFKDGLKKIKGKYYAFDAKGRMLSGVVLNEGSHYYQDQNKNMTGDDWTDLTGAEFKAYTTTGVFYLFGDEEKDGSRKTGYQNVEFDDDTYQMYFGTNGKATTGYVTKIKKFTKNGIILKADNDNSNYAVVKIGATATTLDADDVEYVNAGFSDESYVLVNASGTVQKNAKNLKDNNDLYYFTDSQGRVEYVSNEKLTTTAKNNTYKFTYYKNVDAKTDSNGKDTGVAYYYDAD